MATQLEKNVVKVVDRDTMTEWHSRLVDIQDELAKMMGEIDAIETDQPHIKLLLKNKIELVAAYANDSAEDFEELTEAYSNEKED